MRGLKQIIQKCNKNHELSHLLQMRGLKRLPSTIDARTLKSHLLQMRGLKLLITLKSINLLLVASFTDAWIETNLSRSFQDIPSKSHLLQMRGLKLCIMLNNKQFYCRIFYRCVD